MKRGNRILALGLCLTMLFMALPIQNLQASTIAQQQVLYSLNGTAHLADETATDTSCLYYDTFTVSDGYTAALGNSNVTGIATYDEAQQNLSIGGFGGSNEHRLVPFAGITDAANLQNYMISADISVKASSAIAGVSAYTNGAVKGFTGYEFYIMEDELYLRCRATSELKVRKDSITNYFPDYKTGDTIRLSLAVVTNDNNVEAVGIISYNGVNKIVGGKQTFTGADRWTCGIPALRAFASTTTEILYTADNVLVEAVTGGIDGVISEIINKEALYSLNGTAHSADGRREKEPFGTNYSVSLFANVKGPVSVIASMTKQHFENAMNGGPLTLEFHQSIFADDDGIEKVGLLVKNFIDRGGHQLQLNTVNLDKMLDAQKHPENYRQLVVRIWGWSAYFVELDKEYQDHVIARQAYTV